VFISVICIDYSLTARQLWVDGQLRNGHAIVDNWQPSLVLTSGQLDQHRELGSYFERSKRLVHEFDWKRLRAAFV
jgi:hypothetical protein